MWKDYSKSYIKNNRASSISIVAASFIAALFLSLLCSVAYNFWCYDVEAVILEEGDWQGRITGNLSDEDIETVKNFAGIKKAEINKNLSTSKETVVDLYFEHVGNAYSQMPLIIKQLGLNEDAASYHTLLLSKYFVNDPSDDSPPLLLFYYAIILIIMMVSLILIIRNSFEITMDARIQQFGILSSIGATPKQIRTCLLQESAILSMIPICVGTGMGILISFGLIAGINNFASDVAGRHEAYFQYHLIVLVITIVISLATVLISAWIPAKKLSKITPLEAIRGTKEIKLNKVKHSRVLYALFGIEGELAGNALKAQKKSLRISSISLFLSFLGFCVMLCFTTLSEISTNYTYFERYQNAWDVMITLKDTDIEKFNMTQQIQEMDEVKSATVYQKSEGITYISNEMESESLIAHGGLGNYISSAETENGYAIKTPIVILDDASFQEYCNQIGISDSLNGTVILNRIWDSQNSNFRNKEYIQFINENSDSIMLYPSQESNIKIEVPILSYTTQAPELREEYENYSLVNFVSLSTWNQYLSQFEHSQPDSYIRIFSKAVPTLDSLNKLEDRVVQSLDKQYVIESENRIKEKITNDEMTQGMVTILGGFCILLATIGIANVFLNSLGFIRQRKREFAQYMSIGLTPKEMKKMLGVEALVISGKPIIISLVLTVVSVQFMIRASYLESNVFWSQAPVIPMILFAVFIVGTVAIAFYIGGKRILKADLTEALKSDI